LAGLGGALRSSTGEALDGEFSIIIPSGDGVSGGDFVSTFAVGPGNPSPTNIVVKGCGSIGLEAFLLLALLRRARRR
jgi:hypothetical protein